MTKDLRMRSMAKALSWRIVATCTTMVIVFLFTGRASLTLGVGVFEVVSKLALYYLHERIWNAVWWGKALLRQGFLTLPYRNGKRDQEAKAEQALSQANV